MKYLVDKMPDQAGDCPWGEWEWESSYSPIKYDGKYICGIDKRTCDYHSECCRWLQPSGFISSAIFTTTSDNKITIGGSAYDISK